MPFAPLLAQLAERKAAHEGRPPFEELQQGEMDGFELVSYEGGVRN